MAEPNPKRSLEATVGAHYLAVEGVQPPCPENLSASGEKEEQKRKKRGNSRSRRFVKTALSEELQEYYEKIVEAIRSLDDELLEAVVDRLQHDPVHQLLPYLVQFFVDEVQVLSFLLIFSLF